MHALPQDIAPNPHTNLLNVYVQIANKIGFQQTNKNKCKRFRNTRHAVTFGVLLQMSFWNTLYYTHAWCTAMQGTHKMTSYCYINVGITDYSIQNATAGGERGRSRPWATIEKRVWRIPAGINCEFEVIVSATAHKSRVAVNSLSN
jgi:hypothetical protein